MSVMKLRPHRIAADELLRDELKSIDLVRGVVMVVWEMDGSLRSVWSEMPVSVLSMAGQVLNSDIADVVKGARAE